MFTQIKKFFKRKIAEYRMKRVEKVCEAMTLQEIAERAEALTRLIDRELSAKDRGRHF